MYCEKEKECPIYQIHRELNGHYQRLINELLGKGYYNMGMDAYSGICMICMCVVGGSGDESGADSNIEEEHKPEA